MIRDLDTAKRSPRAGRDGQQDLWNLLGSVPLVKYGPPSKTRATRRLLGDIGIRIGGTGGGGGVSGGAGAGGAKSAGKAATGGAAGESGGVGRPSSSSSSSSSSAKSRKGKYVSFWKPEVRAKSLFWLYICLGWWRGVVSNASAVYMARGGFCGFRPP